MVTLQKALKELSVASRRSDIDPKAPQGLVYDASSGVALPPDNTMAALAAAVSLIGSKLSTVKRVALAAALGYGVTRREARIFVLENAGSLAQAVRAATIVAPYYVKPEEAGSGDTNAGGGGGATAIEVAWYKTWWGIGAIAVGAIGVLALLASARGSGGVSGLGEYSRYRVRVGGKKGQGSLCVSAQSKADAKDMVRGNLKKGQRVTRVEHGC